MDPARGCPPQIPDRGQYVHSSHRSKVEEVGRRRKDPREHTGHNEETGTGRAEGGAGHLISDKFLPGRPADNSLAALLPAGMGR